MKLPRQTRTQVAIGVFAKPTFGGHLLFGHQFHTIVRLYSEYYIGMYNIDTSRELHVLLVVTYYVLVLSELYTNIERDIWP
jgi:hypothetical protein